MSKKILITTWCTDDYADFLGVNKLINSIKYFHPEVDCIIFNTEMSNQVYGKYSWIEPKKNKWMTPPSCIPFIENYDMVIHMDADSTITGPMDELFNSNADIISSRCYNSFNLAQAWSPTQLPHHPPFGNGDIIPTQKYVCGGLLASNNKEFWYHWHDVNHYFSDKPEQCLDEQCVLNLIFHSNKYTSEIVDPIGSNLSYGINNGWGPEYDPWQSWKQMYIKDNQLYLNDPVTNDIMHIKVLHQAGGALAHKLNRYFGGMRNWMTHILPREVNEYLNEVTNG
jgi:hypothetical protein